MQVKKFLSAIIVLLKSVIQAASIWEALKHQALPKPTLLTVAFDSFASARHMVSRMHCRGI